MGIVLGGDLLVGSMPLPSEKRSHIQMLKCGNGHIFVGGMYWWDDPEAYH